jgi:hypothetical protein
LCPIICYICSAFIHCLRLKWQIYLWKMWHFSPCTFCVLMISLSDFVSGGRLRNREQVQKWLLCEWKFADIDSSFELWKNVVWNMMNARNIFASMIVTYYLFQWIFTVWSDRCICYAIWKMFIPEINTLLYFGWKKMTSTIYFIISYVYVFVVKFAEKHTLYLSDCNF